MKQSLEEKIENIFENARYEKDMYDYVGHPYSETDYDLDKVRKGIETLVTEVQRGALNTDKVIAVEIVKLTPRQQEELRKEIHKLIDAYLQDKQE